ncbi:MAG: ATP-binding protein [Pseudomonadota bacterium]
MDRIADQAAVIGAIPLPAMVVGRDKRVLLMNEGACALLGRDASGSHYTSVLRQPPATAALEGTLADSRKRSARIYVSNGAGSATWKLDIASLGETARDSALIVFQDISGEEGLGRMRRDFVANVSHELRTPLTALLGFIETLRGPARKDEAALDRFLGMMESEAERMNRLVQDLLSLSRLESQAKLRPERRVNIAEVVREAAETVGHAMKGHGTAVALDIPDGEIWIAGERDQLLQVVRNLLENAIKYGGGQVDVHLSRTDRDLATRGPAVILDITDNGEGIDPLDVPRLTERFYRVDTHRSRAHGGTGLGLAIVKHIVERHRGRLRISSAKGEGSVFTVILPA